MKIEILFRTQALLNLASAGPAACLFLIVGPGWSCRWRLCRSDRTLNTLTLVFAKYLLLTVVTSRLTNSNDHLISQQSCFCLQNI